MKVYLKNRIDPNAFIHVADELPLWSSPFGLDLLETIHYRKNITALDIGCGTGFPLTELAMRLGEGSAVYGIDPWKPAIDRARQKIAAYGITNIRMIQGVAEEIPLEDGSVDLVVSNNGLNNVSDRERVLAECARVMKHGGQLVLTFNLDTTMHEFYAEFEHVLHELKLQGAIQRMHAHIRAKRPSLNEVLSRLSGNGFEVRKREEKQFCYQFASGTALLNHFFIRLAFLESWTGIPDASLAEEVFDRLEARLNALAERHGSLRLSIPYVVIDARKNQP